jgi:hypothetical protein
MRHPSDLLYDIQERYPKVENHVESKVHTRQKVLRLLVEAKSSLRHRVLLFPYISIKAILKSINPESTLDCTGLNRIFPTLLDLERLHIDDLPTACRLQTRLELPPRDSIHFRARFLLSAKHSYARLAIWRSQKTPRPSWSSSSMMVTCRLIPTLRLKLITCSRKPSRRDYASLRRDAGKRPTDTRVARCDTTARQQSTEIHQAQWQPSAEPQGGAVLEGHNTEL